MKHRDTFVRKQNLKEQVKRLELLLDQAEAKAERCADVTGTLRESFERLFPAAFNNPNLIRSDRWGARAHPSKDHEAHREYFKFIPMSPIDIIESLVRVASLIRENFKNVYDPYSKMKFLDVGCGLGNVVFIAAQKFDAYGIEFSEEYVQAARKMLTATFDRTMDSHIIHCDALDYNEYDQYDIIYWYRPISETMLMTNLATRVVKQMKIGAYLIPIGHSTIWRGKALSTAWHSEISEKVISLEYHPGFQSVRGDRILKKIAPVE